MIYLEDGKVVPVDKSELPVVLPDDIDLNAKGSSSHILVGNIQFIKLPERKLYVRLIHWILLWTRRGILRFCSLNTNISI